MKNEREIWIFILRLPFFSLSRLFSEFPTAYSILNPGKNAYSSQAALPWWLTPQDPHHAVPSAFSTPSPPHLLADSYCVPSAPNSEVIAPASLL